MRSLSLSSTPGTVGQKQQALGMHCAGNGTGESIGIDVVGLAVMTHRNGCENRDQLRFQHGIEDDCD